MADPLQKIVNIDYPEVMGNIHFISGAVMTFTEDGTDYILTFEDVDTNEYIAIGD